MAAASCQRKIYPSPREYGSSREYLVGDRHYQSSIVGHLPAPSVCWKCFCVDWCLWTSSSLAIAWVSLLLHSFTSITTTTQVINPRPCAQVPGKTCLHSIRSNTFTFRGISEIWPCLIMALAFPFPWLGWWWWWWRITPKTKCVWALLSSAWEPSVPCSVGFEVGLMVR